MAGALGIGQLARLEAHNARRRSNAARFTAAFQTLDWLTAPSEAPGYTHVYHQYTVRAPGVRDRLARHLESKGIGTRVYYPTPIHQSPLYRRLGYDDVRCPVAEQAVAEILSIPVHPAVGEEDIHRIIEAVRDFNPRH